MSQDNSKVMMMGLLLVGAYLYSRRNAAPAYQQPYVRPGAVGSMPGSAGTGWQQIGAAALTGFIKAAASGIQNGANSYVPSLYNAQQSYTDLSQTGTVQDVADFGAAYGDWA